MSTDCSDIVEHHGGHLAEAARAVMSVRPGMDAETALEVVLASTCAGPRTVAEAQGILGIKEEG